MTAEDIPAVFEIDKASCAMYWPERSYHYEVERNEYSIPLVALSFNSVITGFAVFWVILDELHLANIVVSKDARRQGIARALLDEGLRLGAERGVEVSMLEVRAGNTPAIDLYRSVGYRTVSVRKSYYQDNGEDALLMDLRKEDVRAYLAGRVKEGENGR